VGSWPKRRVASLVKPIAIRLLVCGACAALAGVLGHVLALNGLVWLLEPLKSRVPADQHTAFLTVLWAHSASYLAGLAGAIVLIVIVIVRRTTGARKIGRSRGVRIAPDYQ
jgi:hypothetical protein